MGRGAGPCIGECVGMASSLACMGDPIGGLGCMCTLGREASDRNQIETESANRQQSSKLLFRFFFFHNTRVVILLSIHYTLSRAAAFDAFIFIPME